ncbi:putative mitochondrial protein AtMg00310 [Silene latifolia]|uniref:putative mitochondrial protein AtMg00310 n=1 Tax=Silene latifolia TaxID=37657 RepID=UPI003D781500
MGRPKTMGGLGFRDFENFNLTLLGKQAWRLAVNSNCLWVRLIRAKYFLNGDFMAASMGNSPSYTWRGTLEARSTLERSLRRRIGDGLETKIWGHAWIPGTQTGRVISPCVAGREKMCVAELFRPNGGGWDRCA